MDFFLYINVKKTTWRSVGLVFMCVCVRAYYYNSVLCYCPLRQLFTLPLHPSASHRDTVFWREVHGFHQLEKGKNHERQTLISHVNLCGMGSLISWKTEVVHSILFTINLIFKHYFRPYGGLMKDLHFYILKFILVFF